MKSILILGLAITVITSCNKNKCEIDESLFPKTENVTEVTPTHHKV